MSNVFGYKIPKSMQREFADVIQLISEKEGGEVSPDRIMEAFRQEYFEKKAPFELKFVGFTVEKAEADSEKEDTSIANVDFVYKEKEMHAEAEGDGPLDAVKQALYNAVPDLDFTIMDYDEHALAQGSKAKAVAYIKLRNEKNGTISFGVGESSSITRASVRALFSALNRL